MLLHIAETVAMWGWSQWALATFALVVLGMFLAEIVHMRLENEAAERLAWNGTERRSWDRPNQTLHRRRWEDLPLATDGVGYGRQFVAVVNLESDGRRLYHEAGAWSDTGKAYTIIERARDLAAAHGPVLYTIITRYPGGTARPLIVGRLDPADDIEAEEAGRESGGLVRVPFRFD